MEFGREEARPAQQARWGFLELKTRGHLAHYNIILYMSLYSGIGCCFQIQDALVSI